MKTYQIRPIPWKLAFSETNITIQGNVCFAFYTISANRKEPHDWKLSFSDGHGPTVSIGVTDLQDAKAKAQADLVNRLSPILKSVTL